MGREGVLGEVRDLLGRGLPVALQGPTGIGKSVLLDALEAEARREPGALVLRANGAAAEHALPFAALRDLVAQLPDDLLDTVPGSVREVFTERLAGLDPSPENRSMLCATFHGLLESHTAHGRVLVLLDEVQWLDEESACVLAYARRRLSERVGVVTSVDPAARATVDLTGLQPLDVPPLQLGDTIDLLGAHGLPAHVAQRVHVESGGVPALSLALCGALGDQPSLLGRPAPLPAAIERVLRERVLGLPEDLRETLVHAALLHRPTTRQLERAGRLEAEGDVRRLVQCGLAVLADGALRFTPSAVRPVVVGLVPAGRRAALHRELAEAAPTEAERLRHQALADPRPDPVLAERLGVAAAEVAATGGRWLAAELYLLAADRAPAQLAADRVEWLACAVETAAPGNHVDVVQRALADFLDAPATPSQKVRVRLALPELAGSAVTVLDEVLAAALADAGEDDHLVARVLLQRSRVALMESAPAAAARGAERAVALLERTGDDQATAVALSVLAVCRRWTGGDHREPLERSVELAGTAPCGFVHTSPAYTAARFALYDDRLEEAWTSLRALLGRVERGSGTDEVHVLRSLVEVAVRTGRCRDALELAGRAARISEEVALDPYAGWLIGALAELAGGELAAAHRLAARGVRAAEERGDTRYLQRHLLVLGQARLRAGDAEGARAALERIREIELSQGISDPTVNRWQPELAEALVRLGRLDEAEALLSATRGALDRRTGTDGVCAQLDRAEGVLLGARGDVEGGLLLLDRSAKVLTDVGMRLELGRTLLDRAHLERRRRRAAASRVALEEARALFGALHAKPWVRQVETELDQPRAETGGGDRSGSGVLSTTEARIADEVARGASNREIAERVFVSVKTVEATLTRIYRKLGVRSRTQLAALLRQDQR